MSALEPLDVAPLVPAFVPLVLSATDVTPVPVVASVVPPTNADPSA
ncbi:MAG: hypothetical protein JNK45_09845 [Myxococcales bacterium]|nr:hypothetical protein [Myxococcales bacterium]